MKKTILKFILAAAGAVIVLPANVYAADNNVAQKVAKLKEIRLQAIDGALIVYQQQKSCVQAASTMKALQSCGATARNAMKQLVEKERAQLGTKEKVKQDEKAKPNPDNKDKAKLDEKAKVKPNEKEKASAESLKGSKQQTKENKK